MKKMFALLASFAFIGAAGAASLQDDADRYVQVFNGDKSSHSDAADTLAWMGLSDPRLFDAIERLVLADYQAARNDRHDRNRVARYVRALGFSGQAKYLPTLNKLLGDRAYERFARAALDDQPDYARWNPIISNRATFDSRYSDDVNRVRNMLMSNDLMLKRLAAKRVYFAHQDDVLLELLADSLRATYVNPPTAESDAVAWLVKALGNARKEKYLTLIEEVAAKTKDNRVARHARGALERYRR